MKNLADDIFIFPDVRNLTVVMALVWPENVEMDEISQTAISHKGFHIY